jgi:hypothetical protein
MEWKPLQDWTEPVRRLLKSQSPDRYVSNIHICMEQSSPHKSRKVCCLRMPVCSLFILILAKVSPSISNHRPSGSSNLRKKTGSGSTLPLSESIQPRPGVTAGISSNRGTAQSPPSSAPTQHRPAVTTGVHSNHKIAQPPPSSSASTHPQPLLVTSNHGPVQASRRPLVPISPSPDQTRPVSVPLTKPIPPSQHYQTPPDVAQERQSQDCAFTKETLNIPLKVDVTTSFTPNVAITSHKSRDGGSRNVSSQANPLVSILEGSTSEVPKPNVTPPPLQTQPQKPAQRPGRAWFQRIWAGASGNRSVASEALATTSERSER